MYSDNILFWYFW